MVLRDRRLMIVAVARTASVCAWVLSSRLRLMRIDRLSARLVLFADIRFQSRGCLLRGRFCSQYDPRSSSYYIPNRHFCSYNVDKFSNLSSQSPVTAFSVLVFRQGPTLHCHFLTSFHVAND